MADLGLYLGRLEEGTAGLRGRNVYVEFLLTVVDCAAEVLVTFTPVSSTDDLPARCNEELVFLVVTVFSSGDMLSLAWPSGRVSRVFTPLVKVLVRRVALSSALAVDANFL